MTNQISPLEMYRADLDRYKAQVEAQKPNREAVIKFAELAIRSLLLLTGGAAVALLAFAGHRDVPNLATAIELFGWAASGAVLTAGASYLAQVFITEYDHGTWACWFGDALRVVAVVIWFVSLSLFMYGIYAAAGAVRTSDPESQIPSIPAPEAPSAMP